MEVLEYIIKHSTTRIEVEDVIDKYTRFLVNSESNMRGFEIQIFPIIFGIKIYSA